MSSAQTRLRFAQGHARLIQLLLVMHFVFIRVQCYHVAGLLMSLGLEQLTILSS